MSSPNHSHYWKSTSSVPLPTIFFFPQPNSLSPNQTHILLLEAGGGTCAVQQGQKKFPWVDLPAALIRIGCYFAGWPEKCLPKMSDKHPDRIDASTGPSQWSLKQKRAMEAQIIKGAVKVLPRPDGMCYPPRLT